MENVVHFDKGRDEMFEHVIVDAETPTNPHVKAVGDINGDGRDELVVASSAGGPLVWYDLTTSARHEIAPSGTWSCDAKLVDMDGDGDLDLVIPEWYTCNRLEWYENPLPDGDPATSPWRRHIIGAPRAHDVCVGDMDGDGRPEIVTREQGKAGNQIVIWKCTGPDEWAQRVLECPAGEGLATGDLTGNGRLDIVIGGRWYEAPAGLLGGQWREHVFADWFPDAVVRVADVNGDGRADVVLTRSEGQGRLCWFEAPADPRGRWTEHVVDDSVDFAHGLVVCDLTGDGTLDIATAEMHQSARRRVLVYLGEGDGQTWRRDVLATTGSHNLCVADLGTAGKALVGANWSGDFQPAEMWRLAGQS
jgi:VCBS repeat protein